MSSKKKNSIPVPQVVRDRIEDYHLAAFDNDSSDSADDVTNKRLPKDQPGRIKSVLKALVKRHLSSADETPDKDPGGLITECSKRPTAKLKRQHAKGRPETMQKTSSQMPKIKPYFASQADMFEVSPRKDKAPAKVSAMKSSANDVATPRSSSLNRKLTTSSEASSENKGFEDNANPLPDQGFGKTSSYIDPVNNIRRSSRNKKTPSPSKAPREDDHENSGNKIGDTANTSDPMSSVDTSLAPKTNLHQVELNNERISAGDSSLGINISPVVSIERLKNSYLTEPWTKSKKERPKEPDESSLKNSSPRKNSPRKSRIECKDTNSSPTKKISSAKSPVLNLTLRSPVGDDTDLEELGISSNHDSKLGRISLKNTSLSHPKIRENKPSSKTSSNPSESRSNISPSEEKRDSIASSKEAGERITPQGALTESNGGKPADSSSKSAESSADAEKESSLSSCDSDNDVSPKKKSIQLHSSPAALSTHLGLGSVHDIVKGTAGSFSESRSSKSDDQHVAEDTAKSFSPKKPSAVKPKENDSNSSGSESSSGASAEHDTVGNKQSPKKMNPKTPEVASKQRGSDLSSSDSEDGHRTQCKKISIPNKSVTSGIQNQERDDSSSNSDGDLFSKSGPSATSTQAIIRRSSSESESESPGENLKTSYRTLPGEKKDSSQTPELATKVISKSSDDSLSSSDSEAGPRTQLEKTVIPNKRRSPNKKEVRHHSDVDSSSESDENSSPAVPTIESPKKSRIENRDSCRTRPGKQVTVQRDGNDAESESSDSDESHTLNDKKLPLSVTQRNNEHNDAVKVSRTCSGDADTKKSSEGALKTKTTHISKTSDDTTSESSETGDEMAQACGTVNKMYLSGKNWMDEEFDSRARRKAHVSRDSGTDSSGSGRENNEDLENNVSSLGNPVSKVEVTENEDSNSSQQDKGKPNKLGTPESDSTSSKAKDNGGADEEKPKFTQKSSIVSTAVNIKDSKPKPLSPSCGQDEINDELIETARAHTPNCERIAGASAIMISENSRSDSKLSSSDEGYSVKPTVTRLESKSATSSSVNKTLERSSSESDSSDAENRNAAVVVSKLRTKNSALPDSYSSSSEDSEEDGKQIRSSSNTEVSKNVGNEVAVQKKVVNWDHQSDSSESSDETTSSRTTPSKVSLPKHPGSLNVAVPVKRTASEISSDVDLPKSKLQKLSSPVSRISNKTTNVLNSPSRSVSGSGDSENEAPKAQNVEGSTRAIPLTEQTMNNPSNVSRKRIADSVSSSDASDPVPKKKIRKTEDASANAIAAQSHPVNSTVRSEDVMAPFPGSDLSVIPKPGNTPSKAHLTKSTPPNQRSILEFAKPRMPDGFILAHSSSKSVQNKLDILKSGYIASGYEDVSEQLDFDTYSGLFSEDLLKDDVNVYLVQCPQEVDPKSLVGQKVDLCNDSLVNLADVGGSKKRYETYCDLSDSVDQGINLTVPSKGHKKFILASVPVTGKITVTEAVNLPEVQNEPSRSPSRVPFPKNLKPRNTFIDSDESITKPKKKKHKDRSSKVALNSENLSDIANTGKPGSFKYLNVGQKQHKDGNREKKEVEKASEELRKEKIKDEFYRDAPDTTHLYIPSVPNQASDSLAFKKAHKKTKKNKNQTDDPYKDEEGKTQVTLNTECRVEFQTQLSTPPQHKVSEADSVVSIKKKKKKYKEKHSSVGLENDSSSAVVEGNATTESAISSKKKNKDKVNDSEEGPPVGIKIDSLHKIVEDDAPAESVISKKKKKDKEKNLREDPSVGAEIDSLNKIFSDNAITESVISSKKKKKKKNREKDSEDLSAGIEMDSSHKVVEDNSTAESAIPKKKKKKKKDKDEDSFGIEIDSPYKIVEGNATVESVPLNKKKKKKKSKDSVDVKTEDLDEESNCVKIVQVDEIVHSENKKKKRKGMNLSDGTVSDIMMDPNPIMNVENNGTDGSQVKKKKKKKKHKDE